MMLANWLTAMRQDIPDDARGVVVWALTVLALAAFTGMCATLTFDVIHITLHRFMDKPSWRGRLGAMHQAHHRFLGPTLQRDMAWERRNLIHHILPEFLTQVSVSVLLSGAAVLFVSTPTAVVAAIVMQVVNVGGFIGNFFVYRGYDFNHHLVGKLPSTLSQLWVTPSYHLLHHVHPNHFFSSFVPVVDKVLGLSLPVAGRCFVVTGASGAFGAPLCAWLTRHGATVLPLKFGVDWNYDDITRCDAALSRADVLILAHGKKVDDAMAANCGSFVAFIERYKRVTKDRVLCPEVWAVGSEIEAHPHFGNRDLKIYSASKRAFAKHAWRYYRDRNILYRHIVPSAFRSTMGPGLMSGEQCVAVALFFLRRGFRYVPVTYTGVALVNFAKFIVGVGRAPAPPDSVSRLHTPQL